MKIFFQFCDSHNESIAQWQNEVALLSLYISHKECGFAMAQAEICRSCGIDIFAKKYAQIGVELADGTVHKLFAGRISAFPSDLNGSSVRLELIAEPADYQQQLRKFVSDNLEQIQAADKHQAGNYQFDELFFSRADLMNPTAFLEGDTTVFYWNMKDGILRTSDVFNGRKELEISGDEILHNSIKVRLLRDPYRCVNLHVKAHWIQQKTGVVDLVPMIAACFRGGKINSFNNIKYGLENLCRFNEKSGYRLLLNDIYEIDPKGFRDQYPLVSPAFAVQGNKVQFKRFYFGGRLVCSWHYRQKRSETVHVQLRNSRIVTGREKDVYFTLGDLQLGKKYPSWLAYTYYSCADKIIYDGKIWECKESHQSSDVFSDDKWKFVDKIPDALTHDDASSFFAGTRGHNALKYAIKRGAALLKYSQRSVVIEFAVNAGKYLLDATLDNNVKLKYSRFPGGYISGKIIKTQFLADSESKILKITLGCAVDSIPQDFHRKLAELQIDVPMESRDRVNPEDLVQNITVKNTPEEQLELLAQSSVETAKEMKDLLKKHATKIQITMHPQNSMREISSDITLPDFII